MSEDTPRVLSIQSHVVHGYVGNKSAVFPLQVLGFEVDSINTVQFSTHTGYKHIKGNVLQNEEMEALIEGLTLNEVDYYTHLITGYSRSPDSLKQIAEIIKKLKLKNPNLIYVCDPVMGDNGKMYVPEDILPVYRDIVVPLADIITPNQFEAELMTGLPFKDLKGALKVIETLHQKGVKTVVLSSTDLGDSNNMIALASSKGVCYTIEIPKVEATFTGTGDLFAALFLAWSYKTNNDLKVTLEKTIATLQSIVKDTYQRARGPIGFIHPDSDDMYQIESYAIRPQDTDTDIGTGSGLPLKFKIQDKSYRGSRQYQKSGVTKQPSGKISKALMELRLIQNKAVIENPAVKIAAIEMS